MTLDELIAALERAEGPSRELDEAIASNVGWRATGYRQTYRATVGVAPNTRGVQTIPHFTKSVDAAMTLVPQAPWPWNITMATAYGSASVMPWDGESTGIHDPRGGHARDAATPAIALCIAALKARKTG